VGRPGFAEHTAALEAFVQASPPRPVPGPHDTKKADETRSSRTRPTRHRRRPGLCPPHFVLLPSVSFSPWLCFLARALVVPLAFRRRHKTRCDPPPAAAARPGRVHPLRGVTQLTKKGAAPPGFAKRFARGGMGPSWCVERATTLARSLHEKGTAGSTAMCFNFGPRPHLTTPCVFSGVCSIRKEFFNA
jgi:hypothetical protein